MDWEKALYQKGSELYRITSVIDTYKGPNCYLEVRYLLAKFPKLAVLILTKLGPYEAGISVKDIVKVFHYYGNIEIEPHRRNSKGANPY